MEKIAIEFHSLSFGVLCFDGSINIKKNLHCPILGIDVELKYLLEYDIKGFNNLNKIENERHQVLNTSQNVIDVIIIKEGIKPTLRVKYIVETEHSKRWGFGEEVELKCYSTNPKKYAALPLYNSHCVTW